MNVFTSSFGDSYAFFMQYGGDVTIMSTDSFFKRRNACKQSSFKIETNTDILLLLRVQLIAHAVFDVVVDDEVKLLFRETIMLRQQLVDLVDDRLRF